MHITVVELEFVELPDKPKSNVGLDNGYLLSMWDCSCRIVRWNSAADRFEDAGGLLNPLAIRSWAKLPKPLDDITWGEDIVRAALTNDQSRPDAGWLESKYETSGMEEIMIENPTAVINSLQSQISSLEAQLKAERESRLAALPGAMEDAIKRLRLHGVILLQMTPKDKPPHGELREHPALAAAYSQAWQLDNAPVSDETKAEIRTAANGGCSRW